MPSTINFDASLLGGLSPTEFLRDYWQKKPLLIRQAMPQMQPVLPVNDLFALAENDEVESRLVRQTKGKWQLSQGPLEDFPRQKKDWTLLVQGVNLHCAAADALMRRFDFLPNTRLDDLMISYAVDGGGVGPHFDSYDVFLLQAEGQRRWQISAQTRFDLMPGAPLKILSNFCAEQEFVLDPGDMLYLPPQIAHNGVAIGSCMTYSIGFRAPTFEEIAREFLFDQAERVALGGRYSDPSRRPVRQRGMIDSHLIKTLFEPIQKIRWNQNDFADFLGRYLTEPKAQIFFDPPKVLSPNRFRLLLEKKTLQLDLKTQMLYHADKLFINGEPVDSDADMKILKNLADKRVLDRLEFHSLEEATIRLLHEWHCAGWVTFAMESQT